MLEAIVQVLLASFDNAVVSELPYKHWYLLNCLPLAAVCEILSLPFKAPDLGGVSGRREIHNDSRTYFDADNCSRHPVCAAVAGAFQDRRVTERIEGVFGPRLAGSFLRIEFAQDTDGFWLEPHTDLGVKLFTMLLYLSRDASHRSLGTDLYDEDKRHVGRTPFISNTALVFIPSSNTFHGFEKRPIHGVRKSLIINYVTDAWRAREQLAFRDRPVA